MIIPQINYKLQVQMKNFLGKLFCGYNKTLIRFIIETVYGILKTGSVRLSDIARSLEEDIPLIKTENRLSRQLSRKYLDYIIQRKMIESSIGKIKEDTLLILDLSDIKKNFAKKMEYIYKVRDGSTGEITDGYWLLKIIGFNKESSELIPLYSELYSTISPDYKSENKKIFNAIDILRSNIGTNGIYVMDRGCDRNKIFKYLIKHNHNFIIRLNKQRHLIYNGKKYSLEYFINISRPIYRNVIIKELKSGRKRYNLSFKFFKVFLPAYRKKQLYLLIINGFGEEPLMLLTSLQLRKKCKLLIDIALSYVARWKIEETIRFEKQSFNLEDIRVLKYQSLRNLITIVNLVVYFISVVLVLRINLRQILFTIIDVVEEFFEYPDFKYYTIFKGIKKILSRSSHGITIKTVKNKGDPQLSLFW